MGLLRTVSLFPASRAAGLHRHSPRIEVLTVSFLLLCFAITGNPPCAVCLCRLPITLGVTGITLGVSGNTLGVLKMGRCPRHFNPVMFLAVTSISPPPSTRTGCSIARASSSKGRTVVSNKWGESSHAFKTHIIADAAFIQSCLTATTLSPEGQGYRKRDCIPCRET